MHLKDTTLPTPVGPARPGFSVAIRTAAWYGDATVDLPFPAGWQVTVHAPELPRPLELDEIVAAVRAPVGAEPLAAIARGARTVVVVVDDLTRPTPVEPILEVMLDELDAAGVARTQVTVLVASGTHGPLSPEGLKRKVGDIAGCRVVSHDDQVDCPKIGVSRMGTPVFVNRAVADADLVVGIGGVYPQHSAGFGGGSKLALGILGRRSIARLHFGHAGAGGRYDVANDFRADLDEIARMVGLRWIVMAHVDGQRRIVRAVAGDPAVAYAEAAAYSREAYAAVMPAHADVVIANAYPMDISATFMRSKGIIPLQHATRSASRILIAACPEGIGHHGLFPLEPLTGFARVRRRIDVAWAQGWTGLLRLGASGVRRLLPGRHREGPSAPRLPIIMYQTMHPTRPLPDRLPGMQIVATWAEVIDAVRSQQGGRNDLTVVVYPCAPLQVFE
jgi:nickel-dependent lactate racemase